ncbi:hypothetical protein SAMN05421690_101069 [Nitrosomonas sp. Nm51]|uniref:hypothetical protein n=1 Tax=Nitrosomonas sp. Nm51 TaxID=133720 RepID=UPI0008BF63E0|nr:hypothetical protein [Nitrosomonas sp. Nm51]SER16364.1 hypothetical protein SAMN05421690_101069 [Nitrosomonas sp. Nm51]
MNKRPVSTTLLILILLLLLFACAGLKTTRDKPLRHQATIEGDPVTLARCMMRALNTDTRPSMKLYHYRFRIYPDIAATQIFAYDTRFLPYIYSSNSPQNPDAIRDYIGSGPEVLRGVREIREAGYRYGFVLTMHQTDGASSRAAVKGDSYVSGIAWNHILSCADAVHR